MESCWEYKHCEKRNVVFEKEVIFHEFDFETSDLKCEALKSSIIKAHNFVWKGCFFFHYYLATWWPVEPKFSQVCYFMHVLRYSKWKDWSLTITNSVYSVFNSIAYKTHLSANFIIMKIHQRSCIIHRLPSIYKYPWKSQTILYISTTASPSPTLIR